MLKCTSNCAVSVSMLLLCITMCVLFVLLIFSVCVCLCVCACVSVCDHLTPPRELGVKGHIPNTSPLFFLPLLVKHWLRGPQFRGDNEHRSIKRGDNKAKCDRGQHLGAPSHINEMRRRTESKRLRDGRGVF